MTSLICSTFAIGSAIYRSYLRKTRLWVDDVRFRIAQLHLYEANYLDVLGVLFVFYVNPVAAVLLHPSETDQRHRPNNMA